MSLCWHTKVDSLPWCLSLSILIWIQCSSCVPWDTQPFMLYFSTLPPVDIFRLMITFSHITYAFFFWPTMPFSHSFVFLHPLSPKHPSLGSLYPTHPEKIHHLLYVLSKKKKTFILLTVTCFYSWVKGKTSHLCVFLHHSLYFLHIVRFQIMILNYNIANWVGYFGFLMSSESLNAKTKLIVIKKKVLRSSTLHIG